MKPKPSMTLGEAAAYDQGWRDAWETAVQIAKMQWQTFNEHGYGAPEYAQGRADGREDILEAIKTMVPPT